VLGHGAATWDSNPTMEQAPEAATGPRSPGHRAQQSQAGRAERRPCRRRRPTSQAPASRSRAARRSRRASCRAAAPAARPGSRTGAPPAPPQSAASAGRAAAAARAGLRARAGGPLRACGSGAGMRLCASACAAWTASTGWPCGLAAQPCSGGSAEGLRGAPAPPCGTAASKAAIITLGTSATPGWLAMWPSASGFRLCRPRGPVAGRMQAHARAGTWWTAAMHAP